MANLIDHNCDVCGSNDAAEISCLTDYSNGQPFHVCKDCGFVYVRARRTPEDIAAAWSEELYSTADKPKIGDYSSRIPAMVARQMFVAETLRKEVGIAGKSACDIGAGEGVFLELLKYLDATTKTFGIEPSKINCEHMTSRSIENYLGTSEDFASDPETKSNQFDLTSILWTLEASGNCNNLLAGANQIQPIGGHIVVGTGSRILVPFKKPLQYYVDDRPNDTHAFRFSRNSLANLYRKNGYEPVFANRYIDSDVFCLIGKKVADVSAVDEFEIAKDDYREVIAFFDRWHLETKNFYSHK